MNKQKVVPLEVWSMAKGMKDLSKLLSLVHDISARLPEVRRANSPQLLQELNVLTTNVFSTYAGLFKLPEDLSLILKSQRSVDLNFYALELFEAYLFDLDVKIKRSLKDADV